MAYQWVDCDRRTVSGRYDRLARFIPVLDRLFFLPRDLRRMAAARLALSRGDSVLEIGCGTGNSFSYLRDAVGPAGRIYGVDISPGMLGRAQSRCDANQWRNIELHECDAVDYVAPALLDGVLFSLSYNTMPQHRAVLRKAWRQLRPGGRLVIMDAKLPPGRGGKMLLPFSIWLMKHTMLGNPLIQPWRELAALTEHFDMSACLFSSYYICHGMKSAAAVDPRDRFAAFNGSAVEMAHRIAAE